MESGVTPSLACTNGNQFANYFAQIGFQYFTGAKLVWADTTTNCIGQTVSLAYTGGHVYFFEIYVNSSSQWTMLGEDLNTSQYFTRAFPIAVQYNTFHTSDHNTSVWFENQDTSNTWAPYFTSNLLSANDAHYDLSRNSGWNLWNSDARDLYSCGGIQLINDVLTGNLQNSNTAQWDMQKMETYHC